MNKYAISGTRNYNIPKFLELNLYKILDYAKAFNNIVYVGDCPSGIDLLTKLYCKKNNISFKIFHVVGERNVFSLRERTKKLILESDLVFCFPKNYSSIRSGTWLSCFEGLRRTKKVFICLEKNKLTKNFSELPKTKELDFYKNTNSEYWLQAVRKKNIQEELNF